jgi:hypothetical protein
MWLRPRCAEYQSELDRVKESHIRAVIADISRSRSTGYRNLFTMWKLTTLLGLTCLSLLAAALPAGEFR